jgi:hypothetical protein
MWMPIEFCHIYQDPVQLTCSSSKTTLWFAVARAVQQRNGLLGKQSKEEEVIFGEVG